MTLQKMLTRLVTNAMDAAAAGDHARHKACRDIAEFLMWAIPHHGNMELDFPG